jgi:hypothetical protein
MGGGLDRPRLGLLLDAHRYREAVDLARTLLAAGPASAGAGLASRGLQAGWT